MADQPYQNREIDEKFDRLIDKVENFETDTRNSLTRIETKTEGIDNKVAYTNGKVRKIIMALILVFGILIGQNFPTVHDVLATFSSVLTL